MDVILKPDRQRSLERRHPWIFSGAVAKINGEPSAGETVTIKSADGKFLAYAGWSPKSQFVARRTSEPLAYPAQAGCRFKLEAESGRQVAVAPAQPLYRNGQMQFRISRATQGAELEVRFKPGGRFKPRFSHSEVIRTLNEVAAGAELMQLQQEELLPRVKGWEFVAGTYVATFAVSEAFFSRIGTGFLDFGLDLANALRDIHPSGSADTTDCAALMQTLAPLN